MTKRLFALILLGVLFLTGCNVPTSSPTPVTSSTATNPPEPTLPAEPTAPPASTDTSAPVEPPAGAVITPENAANLTSRAVTIPEWVNFLLWPGDSQLTVQTDNRLFYPLDLETMELGEPTTMEVPGTVISFAPDGSVEAVLRDDNSLAIFDAQGNLLHELDAVMAGNAVFSADGSRLAVTSHERFEIVVYDVASAGRVATLTGFTTAAPVYSAFISPDGATVAWWARANLQLQDVATGEMGLKLSYSDFINNVAFSPDNRFMAVLVGNAIEVYDLTSGQRVHQVTLSGPVYQLDFSPDSRLLAAAYGFDLQLWDTSSWAPLAPVAGHTANIMQVSFSPDGRYLVSVDENRELRAWSVSQ